MATALVIQPEEEAGLGWFGDWFAAEGLGVDVVRAYAGERVPGTLRHDALVVLGGAMGAYDDADHPWLTDVKALLRSAVERRVPCLGICLGHQLLSVACGGAVERHPHGRQVGVRAPRLLPASADDPVLGGLVAPVRVLHWNGDVVTRAPQGALPLAEDAHGLTEAYRLGPSAWGVQFHPEASGDTAAVWAAMTESAGHLADLADLTDTVRTVKEAEDDLRRSGAVVARRFARLVRG